MNLKKIAVFPNDHNPDTNQWPIDPTQSRFSHGGAEFTVKLGEPEMDLIRQENLYDGVYSTDEKIQWAIRNIKGALYFSENQDADGTDLPPYYWAAVIMGSKSDSEFNMVNVLDVDKGKSRIETIPILPNYSQITRAKYPWLFHRVWVTNSRGVFDSPKGVFYMPLFDGLYRKLPALKCTGMWIRNEYVSGNVSTETPPPPPPSTDFSRVRVIRRTVLRRFPNGKSSSMGVAKSGNEYIVLAISGDWGYTGKRTGWIYLSDTIKIQ